MPQRLCAIAVRHRPASTIRRSTSADPAAWSCPVTRTGSRRPERSVKPPAMRDRRMRSGRRSAAASKRGMATATQTQVLKTAVATYPHTKALKDGRVTIPGVELDHVEITPIIGAFRRMCRRLEFDVCEMAVTTYLTARAFGKPFTALPVFVMRQFHHSPVVYNTTVGVASPKDLEGKKVGVRAYTVTTGVWARGILATEYGVALDKVTWVVNDEEHVEEYQKAYPANVVYQPGANFAEMVASGELTAAIGAGRVESPNVKPLIPNAGEAEAALVQENRHLPGEPHGRREGRTAPGGSDAGAPLVPRVQGGEDRFPRQAGRRDGSFDRGTGAGQVQEPHRR